MTAEEYERDYFARWGFPCWGQYLREALARGESQKKAFHDHSLLVRESAVRAGLVD